MRRLICTVGLVLAIATAARALEAGWPPEKQKVAEFTGNKQAVEVLRARTIRP